jgi:hypothetical protein
LARPARTAGRRGGAGWDCDCDREAAIVSVKIADKLVFIVDNDNEMRRMF